MARIFCPCRLFYRAFLTLAFYTAISIFILTMSFMSSSSHFTPFRLDNTGKEIDHPKNGRKKEGLFSEREYIQIIFINLFTFAIKSAKESSAPGRRLELLPNANCFYILFFKSCPVGIFRKLGPCFMDIVSFHFVIVAVCSFLNC